MSNNGNTENAHAVGLNAAPVHAGYEGAGVDTASHDPAGHDASLPAWSWMTPGGYDQALNNATPDENACLRQAIGILRGSETILQRAGTWAHAWVADMRKQAPPLLSIERLLQDYPLATPEGLALMRLAEALVRTPDETTRAILIADKLSQGHWDALRQQHQGLKAWQDAALAWASKVETAHQRHEEPGWWTQLMAQGIDRTAAWMLRQIGQQFVAGVCASDVSPTLLKQMHPADRLSFDSLGESAQTQQDVDHYLSLYGQTAESLPANGAHGMSVKLSALHPQFDELHRADVMQSLPRRVASLAKLAALRNIPLTIDAEESDRLMLTLDVAHAVHEHLSRDTDPAVSQWQGLGIAVQAYQKRALKVIELLLQHASDTGRRWQIRLVKGAYWDTEIMRAQQAGLKSYPVLTSRAATDMNYLACARLLMRNRKRVYPMFGTHNALTLASILSMTVRDAQQGLDPGHIWNFECQRLHGMGESLWYAVRQLPAFNTLPCRIYTPVGSQSSALSYLIRRLLENGANTSFIHQLHNAATSTETLLQDPLDVCTQRMFAPAENLPDPPRLYGKRRNSAGYPLANRDVQRWASNGMKQGEEWVRQFRTRFDACALSVPDSTCSAAHTAYANWSRLPAHDRATCLEQWAARIEIHADQALALLCHESHKTASDALGEVREAVDFLRYYAQLARAQLAHPVSLTSPAGEKNLLTLHGRGVWLCISPWNFPLAIFVGQIAAALASGNTVIAKPAEPSCAIAAWAVDLAHASGIPASALHLMPAAREQAATWLTHPAIAGVSFTGSNTTARHLRMLLAQRDGPQIPLIAETGGMNAMIVDSTALPEQAVEHIVASAFNMAGQRCSALRVLYLQDDIAESILTRLQGRIATLSNTAARHLHCDVPPVIDAAAHQRLQIQWHGLAASGQVIVPAQFSVLHHAGQALHLCSPGVVQMQTPHVHEEIFGPILQVCTFPANGFRQVLDTISQWGWGLTAGLQSRVDERIALMTNLPVGNIYINRPMIGAVVGVQPFGGCGLSGTGPKAGGPHSLLPYCTERLTSINTAAAGGVMELLTLAPDPIRIANRFDKE